jgi:hypothetical protein
MSVLVDVKLVLAIQVKHNEVAISQRSYEHVALLACDCHCIQSLMRFNCILTCLRVLVPDLEGLLNTTCDKLICIQILDACDLCFVD